MFSSPILLIDDEPTMNELYRRALSGRGYKVFAVGSGEDALEVIHRELPELVISDVMMPGMTGFELCEKLVRAGEKRMPFLFLTANDSYGVIHDGLMAGGDDFLVKGMDLALLEERVRFWLKTPFYALPEEPRRRAVDICATAMSDLDLAHARPIESLGVVREDIRAKAIAIADAALRDAGADYLKREEVPLSFLGFLAGVIDVLTANDLPALLRYADYISTIIHDLKPAWGTRARPVFASFDEVAAGDHFKTARAEGARAAKL